ncbi:MAG TPA: peptidoglycan-associated lipoprotein Pal [Candidatus Sulfotelmatobacter sp.]|nr:peptidoglycan-associated lipoprotein Pal [Candidatus Sulfotelmatobacter sp.]
MTQFSSRTFTLATLLVGVLFFAGCNKKAAKATPPSPPPPAAPTATLAANPAVIEQGQSTTLTWHTDNATDITIDGIGAVNGSGSKTITPNSSMTYTLMAKGPGGTQDATARVTVNAKVAQATVPQPSDEDLFARNVKDVLFDYDKAEIRTDQTPSAQSDASFLTQHPSIKVLLEGHCDDRGSEEYNLALGTSRAESLKKTLLAEGISADRIKTISYGKEKPFCTQDNEQCWQQNRVDHVSMAH